MSARFGTPRYSYQLREVRRAHGMLRAALPEPSTLYYSLKANPHPDLVRALIDLGCVPEVCSSGELDSALTAGADPGACLYGGPGKTLAEIEHALRRGVRRFSVESFDGLRALDEVAAREAVNVDVLLRVNADYAATGGLRMAGRASQFGIDDATLDGPLPAASGAARVTGLHFFPLSCAADLATLAGAFRASIRTAARIADRCALTLAELDLGGGFAAPYARPGTVPDYQDLRTELTAALDETLPGWRDRRPLVSFESGRYLVATSGVLTCAVTDVKRSRGRTFAVVESGINHLGGMSGLGRLLPAQVHPAAAGTSVDTATVDTAPVDGAPVDVVGPLCTPLDVHVRDALLGGVRPGDLLEIPNVGAYGLSASLLAFLGRPAPAEIVLDGDRVVSATALRVVREPVTATGPARCERAAPAVAVAARNAPEVDRLGRFPVATLAALRRSGLLGLLVPAEHGGMGGTLADVVDVAMRLGGACLSSSMVFAMHCQQVDALVRYAGPTLRSRLLPRIAAGELYLGSVTTEPTTGGNLLTSTAALVCGDGTATLDRAAPIVTGGRHADGFLITMRSGLDASPNQVSLVYADRHQLDLDLADQWDTMGMRGVENVAMVLRGTVADEQIVGGLGRFREIAVESFGPLAFLGWSAGWLGATRSTWSALLARFRSEAGRVDLRSPLTAERVARIRARLETVGAYLETVLAEIERHRHRGTSVDVPATQIRLNTLKLVASEQCLAAARAMLDLAGLDTGYRRDSPVPVERLVRDLTAAGLTFSNTRLLTANGALSVLDPEVSLAAVRHHKERE
jgi:diaminopimelate decarboxylase/alkylation response protein AidB-like acyl-CoA dehydrogenase